MAINPRPVPSDDDVQMLVSMLVRIAHALGITTPDVIAGILSMTYDMHGVGVGDHELDSIVGGVRGPTGVLLSRAYRVVIDTYYWSDSMHDEATDLVTDGDAIAND